MGVAPVKADDLPSKTLSLIMSTPPILYDPINVTQGPIGERTVFEAVLEPLIISDGMGNYYHGWQRSYEYRGCKQNGLSTQRRSYFLKAKK